MSVWPLPVPSSSDPDSHHYKICVSPSIGKLLNNYSGNVGVARVVLVFMGLTAVFMAPTVPRLPGTPPEMRYKGHYSLRIGEVQGLVNIT